MRLSPLALLLCLVPLACSKASPPATEQSPVPTGASAAPVVSASASNSSAVASKPVDSAIPATATMAEALAYARPLMADTIENQDGDMGSRTLANWMNRKPDWAAIQTVPETSVLKFMKDADEERGKRLCIDGKVSQIRGEKSSTGARFYLASMEDQARHYFFLVALGGSGELVAGSKARFCGVATGRYTYRGAFGAQAQAIRVVGMFDLPENKKTP